MKKYRKKPVVIEAVQYLGGKKNAEEILNWINEAAFLAHQSSINGNINITTIEGVMSASIDDWIIKGVKGDFYPCKPDIFDLTYEIVLGWPNDDEEGK